MRPNSNGSRVLGTALAALLVTALAPAASAQTRAKAKAAASAYPLGFCPVSGEKLGAMGKPAVIDYQGREVRFCCPMCIKKFKNDPARYLKKIDAAIIKQQKPYYPLTTCVVLGDPLQGDGWQPVDYVYRNRLVRFCCKKCRRKFDAAPKKYLKKLDEAVIKAQAKSYPLKTCVVSGEPLGHMGDAVNHVFANRLVRFCCPGCIKKFQKDPLRYLAKLDKGRKAEAGEEHGRGAEEGHGHHEHK